jgi:hypothetical protein
MVTRMTVMLMLMLIVVLVLVMVTRMMVITPRNVVLSVSYVRMCV